MTRSSVVLLAAGLLLFIALILSHGIASVSATLALAGWGIVLVALFHLLPLAVDAAAISVLFPRSPPRGSWLDAVLARWLGESASSLLPFGQVAGPVVTARHLWRRGLALPDAVAAITVSTALQAFAQLAFALMGIALLGFHSRLHAAHELTLPLLLAGAVLAITASTFYVLQRHGLFSRSVRIISRLFGRYDWSSLLGRAAAIDVAIQNTRDTPRVSACFWLNLLGWIVGTGEVYLILRLLSAPLSWSIALLLESVGQAIRGAAFAIPGALGVQEGGYLLLAPIAGISPETALALSLAKRAREILLGVPGLVVFHFSERTQRPATAR
jgi:putative membrane protein